MSLERLHVVTLAPAQAGLKQFREYKWLILQGIVKLLNALA